MTGTAAVSITCHWPRHGFIIVVVVVVVGYDGWFIKCRPCLHPRKEPLLPYVHDRLLTFTESTVGYYVNTTGTDWLPRQKMGPAGLSVPFLRKTRAPFRTRLNQFTATIQRDNKTSFSIIRRISPLRFITPP